MKYLMLDISGKVLNYDIALCEAISDLLLPKDSVELLAANIDPKKIQCKSKKLISLIPKSLRNSENKFKRSVKAFECILNYIYVVFILLLTKVDVLHLQWLPFLEVSSIECVILHFVKFISPKTKLILTVHNIYPHNFDVSQKISYQNRFNKVEKFFNRFIVHLQVSKIEFCKEFSIDSNRVEVIHHGIFVPRDLEILPHKCGKKLNLIMYGNQSYYKGTDILVDAISLLSKEFQMKIHTLIVGKIEPNYYADLKNKSKNLDIEWIPKFVPDDVLNKKILESDVIVLPYRQISQSGVLLLALNFRCSIITSNLPSFKETLCCSDEDMFFESENALSLSLCIKRFIDKHSDVNSNEEYVSQYRNLYSWDSSAKKTIDLLNSLLS